MSDLARICGSDLGKLKSGCHEIGQMLNKQSPEPRPGGRNGNAKNRNCKAQPSQRLQDRRQLEVNLPPILGSQSAADQFLSTLKISSGMRDFCLIKIG
jgi:hypothetical protein